MAKAKQNANWMILGYQVLLKNGRWLWPDTANHLTKVVLEHGDQIMFIEPRIANLKSRQTCIGGKYHSSLATTETFDSNTLDLKKGKKPKSVRTDYEGGEV